MLLNQGCFSYLANDINEIFAYCTWVEAQHVGLYSCLHFLHNYFHISLVVTSSGSIFTSSLHLVGSCGW